MWLVNRRAIRCGVLLLCFMGVHSEVRNMNVTGTTIRFTTNGGVDSFLGIRYARPPLGQLRFSRWVVGRLGRLGRCVGRWVGWVGWVG